MTKSIKWRTLFQALWLAATISLFHLGMGSCLPKDCYFAENNIMPFVLILSFPGGLVLIALVESLEVFSSLDFPLLWFLAFTGGYLQWFWLLPKTYQRQEITALRLAEKKEDLPEPFISPTDEVESSPTKRPDSAVPYFDKRGRTPLERAIKLRRLR